MSIPEILYKYRGTERADFFDTLQLRLTPLDKLNDVFEGVAAFKHIWTKELFFSDTDCCIDKISKQSFSIQYGVKKLKIDAKQNPDYIYNLIGSMVRNGCLSNELLKIFNNDGIGILSLSSLNNSELLWSLYADGHRGFAIGLKSNHQFFTDNYWDEKHLRDVLRKVIYKSKRETFYLEGDTDSIFMSLLQKNNVWSFEKEWRLIVSGVTNKKNMSTVSGLVKIPIDLISEIIIGSRSDSKLEYKSLQFCKENYITLKQIEIDTLTYTLHVKNRYLP